MTRNNTYTVILNNYSYQELHGDEFADSETLHRQFVGLTKTIKSCIMHIQQDADDASLND